MSNINNTICQELTMEEMEMMVGGDNGQGAILKQKMCDLTIAVAIYAVLTGNFGAAQVLADGVASCL